MAESKGSWLGFVFYLLGGLALVALVLVLAWFDLTLPLDLRRPVVSPDGDYLAYFDRTGEQIGTTAARDQLVISTVEGQTVAEYPLQPGAISWSRASPGFRSWRNSRSF